MDGIQDVPVRETREAARVERSGLNEERPAFRSRNRFEFEHCRARHSHFCAKAHGTSRINGFNPPEIKCVTRPKHVGVTTAAPHPHSANEAIHQSPDLPQPVGVQPAPFATDPGECSKYSLRRSNRLHTALLYYHAFAAARRHSGLEPLLGAGP